MFKSSPLLTVKRDGMKNAHYLKKKDTLDGHLNLHCLRRSHKTRITAELGAINSKLLHIYRENQKKTEMKLAENIDTNPKAFWKYADSKRKAR